MPAVQTFPTRTALQEAAANHIAAALREGIAAHGQACAALSGGTTPEPAYALLATKPLDWPQIRFGLVDERFVPPDHPASNEALVRRALRKPLEKGARLFPLFAPTSPRNAALAANGVYAPLDFDIALMGMGEDGHTASWFPNSPQLAQALDPNNARSVINVDAPGAAGSAERLTMTLSAIARARRVVLLITGEAKRAKLDDANTPIASLIAACGDKIDLLWSA